MLQTTLAWERTDQPSMSEHIGVVHALGLDFSGPEAAMADTSSWAELETMDHATSAEQYPD